LFNKIRYIFFVILAACVSNAQAQDFSLAKTYFQEGKLAAAKEQIDGFLEGEQGNKAEAWLLKAAIYAGISDNVQLKYLVPDGRKEAFSALERAVRLNKGLAQTELEKDSFAILRTIYRSYAMEGVSIFNAASEKNSPLGFAQALDLFKNALIINRFVLEQQWTVDLHPEVLSVQYNAAQAAINANKEDEALLYSHQLANSRVIAAGRYTTADFFNIYQWLVNYYYIKRDAANLVRYTNFGASIYPQTVYFVNMQVYGYRQLGDYSHLWPVYEKAIKQFPDQLILLYAYCTDLFNCIYQSGTSKTENQLLGEKLESAVKNYIAHQPDSAKGYLLLGKHYYNRAASLQKTHAQPEPILSLLNLAADNFQSAADKTIDRRLPQFKETVLLLVKALEAAQRKGEANEAYKLLGQQ
jgi:hypothetical protein